MKRKIMAILLVLSLALTGCGKGKKEQHSKSFYNTFDTVVSYLAYTGSEEEFEKDYNFVEEEFTRLHKLYDRYNEYPGVNNVCTINKMAGKKPVKVDQDLIDIIKFSIDNYEKAGKKVNIAMGSVLEIWHDVRAQNEGAEEKDMVLPSMDELKQASQHTNIEDIVVDEENMTVFLKDPDMSLDLGAVAKGYTTEYVIDELREMGVDSASINAGGNVRTLGQPGDGRKTWGIAIQHPDMDSSDFLEVLYIGETSVVTSGDYQRNFVKDGKTYHHIIDPISLMPKTIYRSVSIITEDSGLADYLSTALFLADKNEADQILENYPGVEVIWYSDEDGMTNTEGLEAFMKSKGAKSR